ncbi:MAG: 4-alpha-glucanotransferase [Gammaproteobacteria bacterium]|nr:4-alpha-glucanotransferase [Gammaproteobacteria bacterium]
MHATSTKITTHHDPLEKRRGGILLHITSLPNRWENGDLGSEAYHFIDFLVDSGMSIWQTLPLGPTHKDHSPYNCFSAHAGNTQLISLDALIDAGWLSSNEVEQQLASDTSAEERRQQLLKKAFHCFQKKADAASHSMLTDFINDEKHWLVDYALFWVIKQKHHGLSWIEWPTPLRDRNPNALLELRHELHEEIAQTQFEQFLFFNQWKSLKHYANKKGILLFGDIPIFVSHDSADVWVHRECFQLTPEGQPDIVAGVPPDYFSETGQRWGNPHYRWSFMEKSGFSWWVERIETQLKLYDIMRIDHFRGFEAYWSIPANEETAINGHWVKAPGQALFKKLQEHFGALPFIAEDLGIITDEVDALRKEFRLPGMKILQFAFDSDANNPYLPHNHETDSAVYSGTHDNNTTCGWYNALSFDQQQHIQEYLGFPQEVMPWPIIRCAFASVAKLAIIPMQDILMLKEEHRMNTPGTCEGNWLWRFNWEQLDNNTPKHIKQMVKNYNR